MESTKQILPTVKLPSANTFFVDISEFPAVELSHSVSSVPLNSDSVGNDDVIVDIVSVDSFSL